MRAISSFSTSASFSLFVRANFASEAASETARAISSFSFSSFTCNNFALKASFPFSRASFACFVSAFKAAIAGLIEAMRACLSSSFVPTFICKAAMAW